MRKPLFMAICITLGSLILYCGDTRVQSLISPEGGADGKKFLRAAEAETGGTCCTPAAAVFTKLWEGDLTGAVPNSPDIAVGSYRQVVIYYKNGFCSGIANYTFPYFRPNPATGYAPFSAIDSSGRIEVEGSDMQLRYSGCSSDSSVKVHIAVAGVM